MPKKKKNTIEEDELNVKQIKFCENYVSKEFFGSGVESYIAAYGVDMTKKGALNVAYASASRLLSNVKIYTKINELLEKDGLNDLHVDKQLLFIINQHSDMSSKIAAIKEYNKLKNRIINRMEHTVYDLQKLTDDDLKKLHELTQKASH